MVNNPLDVACQHIAWEKNIIADKLSRIYTNSNIPPTQTSLLQNLPQLQGYVPFHPSPELLSLLYSALSNKLGPGPHNPNMLGHFCPAKRHFSTFIETLNLGRDPTLSRLRPCNIVMACYTISLAPGSIILALAIKVGTIERYLFVARKLSTPAGVMDPILDIRGRRIDMIKAILDEAKRWQTVPNRREPLTWEMVHWVQQKEAQEESTGKQDNIYTVLANWFTMSMQACFRKSEWAQDSGLLKSTKDVAKNLDGSAKAFLLSAFTFKGAKGGPITRLSPSSLARAAMVDITWRFQKKQW